MYNEKSELDEELKRLMKDVKSGMGEEIMQAVEQDHAVWLNEQKMAIKATGKTETNSDDVVRQAYFEAAKKTLDAKLNALVVIAQALLDMEGTSAAIKNGGAVDVPLSIYLDLLIPKIKDSLEFGVPESEKKAVTKSYGDALASIQDEAMDRIANSCNETSAKQDLHAKTMKSSGVDNEGVLKDVAREAYLEGAFVFMGESITLSTIASRLLAQIEEKRSAIRSGAESDGPVSAYLEEKMPLFKTCMRVEGMERETKSPQKVS